jgi:tripartite-type tricarboxylate transporter receptor subunit TctC
VVPEVAAQLEAGEVRVLAVMAEQRLASFPEIPTLKESGVDWVAVGWRGLAIPRETPSIIAESLLARCRAVVESPEFQMQMKKLGFDITIRDTHDFAAYLGTQEAIWKPVIEAAGQAKS